MAISDEPPQPPRLSAGEWVALGRAARRQVPRSSHGAFEPAASREDPVELLEQDCRGRIPELIPIRYGRMLASPFAFYRGAATIMAHDLAASPRSGFTVQCCGDAHLANFGVFASPERRLVFDINDFDETLPGPWEWDVKRLASSVAIASAQYGHRRRAQVEAVSAAVQEYREAMRGFAAMGNLEVWYAHVDVDEFLPLWLQQVNGTEAARTRRRLAKAEAHHSASLFEGLAEEVDGRPRIVDRSPLIVPLEKLVPDESRDSLLAQLHGLFAAYRDSLSADRRLLIEGFVLADFARKVVGVGSVGTRTWIALLLGRDDSDPLFLQIKEARASTLEQHLGPSGFANNGERVVTGQRLMQAASDILLGWLHAESPLDAEPRDFYVRQLADWKGSMALDHMTADVLNAYGRLCAWTLARAHARTGDRLAIASYLGSGPSFERAILAFSLDYAEQNESDYARFRDAVRAGRIAAGQKGSTGATRSES